MELVLKIAIYVSSRYYREFGETIEEAKLHRLLYLAQRESLIRLDHPMFPELFEAWKYGPVMVPVRTFIQNFGMLPPRGNYILPDKYLPIMDHIFKEYGHKEVRSLIRITTREYAWEKARKVLGPIEECRNTLRIEDIRRDADRIIIRRYLLKIYKKLEQKINHV